MRRRLLALALATGSLAGSAAAEPTGRPAAIRFDDRQPGRLVVTAPRYRLTLSRKNGAVLGLVERPAGARLVRGSLGCLWGAVRVGSSAYTGGCSFRRSGPERLRHRWDPASATLTLTYAARSGGVGAVATIHARPASLDLLLTVTNGGRGTYERVHFPADLVGDARAVRAGYVPTYLPGIRLRRGFFARAGSAVATYPSRWAFADYLALDVGRGRLALYGVNPAPRRLAPVALGFTRNAAPQPCSGRSFCLVHGFETWLAPGRSWSSPVVRLRVGEPVEATIRAYRRENGIDRYPSLARKLGRRLNALARAPLVKADLWKGLPPFGAWEPELRRLPSPALVHPVAFQPRGHDEGFPDFLPPDPAWGTSADLRGAVRTARSLGLRVMPYLNVSWWDDESPTARGLPRPADFSVLDPQGRPVVQTYGDHSGYVVTRWTRPVREHLARLLEQWRSDVPVDCVFFDQIGARPWLRDFNPASPSPLAYDDGWLALMAPYASRCLMVEDGWDRLAAAFAGFHGGALMLVREHDEPDRAWGEGNWEPYPLAVWLLHDKVLMYQHDLFEATMADDAEVLTWNLAFGLVHSLDWDARRRTLDTPWPELVGRLQRLLGPRYAGRPLASYRHVAPAVTESVFGGLVVRANWSATRPHGAGGHRLAPLGFLARTRDGAVLAGTFVGRFGGAPLSAGTHHVVVQRTRAAVTVHHVGEDTALAVALPATLRRGFRVRALGGRGERLGEVTATVSGGRAVFLYAGALAGRRVTAYRLERR